MSNDNLTRRGCFSCKSVGRSVNEAPCSGCISDDTFPNYTPRYELTPAKEPPTMTTDSNDNKTCVDCLHYEKPGHTEPCVTCTSVSPSHSKLVPRNAAPTPDDGADPLPPRPSPERAAWLLSFGSSCGRTKIDAAQYEELRAEAVALRKSVENYMTEEGHTIPEVGMADCVEALAAWVDQEKARCDREGSIFDTGFRSVSEGGTVWYFDPETIVRYYEKSLLVDKLRKDLAEAREALADTAIALHRASRSQKLYAKLLEDKDADWRRRYEALERKHKELDEERCENLDEAAKVETERNSLRSKCEADDVWMTEAAEAVSGLPASQFTGHVVVDCVATLRKQLDAERQKVAFLQEVIDSRDTHFATSFTVHEALHAIDLGLPLAQKGHRDHAVNRAASILAMKRPTLTAEQAVEAVALSIDAMPTEPEGLDYWLDTFRAAFKRACARRDESTAPEGT